MNFRRTFLSALGGAAQIGAIACGSDEVATPATAASVVPTQIPTSTPNAPATEAPNIVETPQEQPEPPNGPPPSLDTTIRSVELGQVVFDTFNGGPVRLSDATAELIDRLSDAIQPIYTPLCTMTF